MKNLPVKGAFEGVEAFEDVEADPDRWCSSTQCGQALWPIACHWVSPLRLSRRACEASAARYATPSWAPPKEAPPVLVVAETPAEE
jgi:hypothetical protein